MVRVGVKLLHKRTRGERRQARQGILLRDAGVTVRTRVAYFVALSMLMPFIEHIQNEAELDTAVAEWVELCWEDGESLYTVGNALSGLHFYEPLTRRRIPTAWKLFANWRKMEWPARAPPLTRDIILSMAYYAVCHDDLFFSCLLCLGFFALLRTGELLNLRGSDLLVNDTQVVVSLKGTKTGKRNAADEMVTTSDRFTVEICLAVKDVLAAHSALSKKLWEFSPQAFRTHFDRYLKKFKITSYGFRPYSMRRGVLHGYFSRPDQWNLLCSKAAGTVTVWPEFTYRTVSPRFLTLLCLQLHGISCAHGIHVTLAPQGGSVESTLEFFS